MITPQAKSMYPRSAALNLQFVQGPNKAEIPGFDEEAVLAAIGQTRFTALMATVTNVFVCSHRVYANKNMGKPVGTEVHCIYAKDLEAFLASGG